MTDINGIKVLSTTHPDDKPTINEWMNEFNVSSRYEVKHIPLTNESFDLSRFKKNLNKGLIMAEQNLF